MEYPHLYLLSPIPPQKTGTATYFSFFMRDVKKNLNFCRTSIVVDERMHEGEPPQTFEDFPVVKYSSFFPRSFDHVVLFIANNQYHSYCLEELISKRSDNIYSVIHDPQIGMLASALCYENKSIFGIQIYNSMIGGQFGSLSPRLGDWLQKQQMPLISLFITMCQGFTVRNSRVIITHSYYAAVKFLLESDKNIKLPRLMVMDHPPADLIDTGSEIKKPICVFGVFGWLSRSKRPHLIFRAFEGFLSEITESQRADVKIRFVGEIIPSEFDLIYFRDNSGYRDNIESFDYVGKELFETLLLECSLLINLRYPSCGETSGTLAHANTYGISTVTASYQSFFEEASTYKITVDPSAEMNELKEVFHHSYNDWRAGRRRPISMSKFRPKISARMLLEILNQEYFGHF